MKKALLAMGISAALSISGCSTLNEYGITQQQVGTGVGAVVGIGVGSLIGSGNGRIAAMAVGALLGGYIGNNVGLSLDERDKASLASQTEVFLKNGESSDLPQTTTWASGDTGAEAIIKTSEPVQKIAKVKVRSSAKVMRPKSFTAIQSRYSALVSSNLRSGPGTQYQKLDSVSKGSKLDVMGVVDDWLMVTKNGKLAGYVRNDLVVSADSTKPVDVSKNASLPKIDKSLVVAPNEATSPQKTVDKPRVASISEPVVLDFDEVGESQAVVSCKNVQYDISDKAGKKSQEGFEACHAKGGDWVAL
jgi:outer membrane lipoprotein SlyB/uncharacterized protein YraI